MKKIPRLKKNSEILIYRLEGGTIVFYWRCVMLGRVFGSLCIWLSDDAGVHAADFGGRIFRINLTDKSSCIILKIKKKILC